MSKIELGKAATGENVCIDISTLVATRLLVTASSGGGKSETLRRILEEAVGSIQCIVIDPEGEFSTLRERKPFVLVGEGGETPADIRTAGLVATRLLELNASAVCDIYEMRVQERHEWVKRFLDSLVHAPKSLWHPVLVVLDEAHTYCPEHGYGESVASQSVIDLANLGRKRGFCAILATQRLSKLSKNAAEPLQNYLVGRTTFDDQKRAAQTFKIDPGAATREFSLELERLKDGQFICRGRAISGDMVKVQVTRGVTRPPKTGTAMAGVVTPTPEAVKALLPKLADLPREVEKKAKTEDDLRKEVKEARQKIAELERISMQNVGFTERDRKLAEEAVAQQKYTNELRDSLEKAQEKNATLREYVSIIQKIQVASEAMKPLDPAPAARVFTVDKPQFDSRVRMEPRPAKANSFVVKLQSDSQTLTGPEQRILNAIAWLEDIGVESPEQPAVAFLAGYSYGGGAYNNPRGRLNVNGLVEYVPGNRIRLSAKGKQMAEPTDVPSTNDALHESVLARLPGPEQRLLKPLLKSYPSSMHNQTLADAAGYTAGAGAFNNPRGRLKTLGLIEYPQPGMVRARDLLFPL